MLTPALQGDSVALAQRSDGGQGLHHAAAVAEHQSAPRLRAAAMEPLSAGGAAAVAIPRDGALGKSQDGGGAGRPSPRLALPVGRLVELSGAHGCARTTLAVAAVLQAQSDGEPVAWLQMAGGTLYPPDLADSGVDLEAFVVVHIPPSAGPYAMPRAAELLLRSGGYGLVVLDFSPPAMAPPNRMAWQGRLLSVAREHGSRVVLLTQSAAQGHSLGPLVSLRIEPQRQRQSPGSFALECMVLKDKAGVWGEQRTALPLMQRRGPWGLL